MQKKSRAIALSHTAFRKRDLTLLSFGFIILCLGAFFAIDANAQQQTRVKPKLVPIVRSIEDLNINNSDENAAKIAEILYKQYLKTNNLEDIYEYSAIHAKFIPINRTGSNDKFIFAQVMEPPRGCYAKGCATFIYRSQDGKKWKNVFAAHLKTMWYDETSKSKFPANLIASSEDNNKNLGVWMWNGHKYMIANRRKK